jgi:23S rRNA (adenine2503-C2)-methyltransferase
VSRFVEVLRGAHINVQVRERKGDRIDAACGQLRRTAGTPLAQIVGQQA